MSLNNEAVVMPDQKQIQLSQEQVNRRDNINRLMGSEHGSVARFSKATGLSQAQLWQFKNGIRNPGEKVARKIEDAIGLDPHSLSRSEIKERSVPDMFSIQVMAELGKKEVPKEMQDAILYMLKIAPDK